MTFFLYSMKMKFPSKTHLKKAAPSFTTQYKKVTVIFPLQVDYSNWNWDCIFTIKYAIPNLQVYTILKNLGQGNFSYINTIIGMQKFWDFPRNIKSTTVNYPLKILTSIYKNTAKIIFVSH